MKRYDQPHEATMSLRRALLLFLLLSSSQLRGVGSAPGEAEALVEWKDTLTLPGPGGALASWDREAAANSTVAACGWAGVSCDIFGRILGVDVAEAGLAGTFDALDLSALPSLGSLNLSCNSLTGSFPSNVSTPLLNITSVDFSNNSLSGPIPATLPSYMPNLKHLNLSSNQFTGEIPPSLANLTRLQSLNLGKNLLSGGIPAVLGSISGLQALELHSNPLGGVIPASLGKLRSLERINVSVALLESTIPTELSRCTNLTVIGLAANKLSGNLPASWAKLKKVREFNVSKNMLTGKILPAYFRAWTHLEVFQVDNNRFTGEIPIEVGMARSLEFLSLATNNLSGSIPAIIGSLTSLKVLDLAENEFSGTIPRTIGNLRRLRTLRLYDNKLTGRLPVELGNMTALQRLAVSTNMLEGEIPAELSRLPNLFGLVVFDNSLSGGIPPDFGANGLFSTVKLANNSFSGPLPPGLCMSAPRLRLLEMDNNHLTGNVPACYRNLNKLERITLAGNRLVGELSEMFEVHPDLHTIDLSRNSFGGELPEHWAQLKSLRSLHLDDNKISGTIPPGYGAMAAMHDLSVASNRLSGTIPRQLGKLPFLYLNLQRNMLSGGIPVTLGNIKTMLRLDLSGNGLGGGVPVELTELSSLWHLNLSGNSLSDGVPALLGKMGMLQELDLSGNGLGGGVPVELTKLKSLRILNLSSNSLSGAVPALNLTGSLEILDLSGNPGLCGDIVGLNSCNPGGRHIAGLKLVIPLALAAALVVSGAAVACLLTRKRGRSGPDTPDTTKGGSGSTTATLPLQASIWGRDVEFSFGDILAATEHFNEAYCIGKGSFGSVYRADVPSSHSLAVKKLDVSETGDACWGISEKSFENEVRALTHVRHRNIVKLHGFCATGGFMYLVYERVERGSLGKVLYRGGESSAERFDWPARIRAIRGLANALAYLHHDSSPPMIHRDVSINNVLLDADYETRLSDFGTARFLGPGRSHCSSVAGSYGYMAPELAYLRVTTKCDVYSFGVLAMEILMGKFPGELISSLYSSDETKGGVGKSSALLLLKDLLDHRLEAPDGQLAAKVVFAFVVALSCVRTNPDARPTMRIVAQELSSRRRSALDRPFGAIMIGDLTSSRV